MQEERIKIGIQKKGKLSHQTMRLLNQCGLEFECTDRSMQIRVRNLPIDLLCVRDDDIPSMVATQSIDLGIVGENVLAEHSLSECYADFKSDIQNVMPLGFARCYLSLALPEECSYEGPQSFNGLRIATSYPQCLAKYLKENKITATIIPMSGSVEIAPQLGMADVICDLVSTGRTLADHQLRSVLTILESQAVLIRSRCTLSQEKEQFISLLVQRMTGVTQAKDSKYILFHIQKKSLSLMKKILPGFESPTILPLADYEERVAVHLVSRESVFWETLEQLKTIGARSILVLPIEKMMY